MNELRVKPMPLVPEDWFRDRTAIVELLVDLIDRGEITTADEAREIVEKPWRWSGELRRMLRERANEPQLEAA